MSFVNITKGTYHSKPIAPGIFPVHAPHNGKHVTVISNGLPPYKQPKVRIKCEEGDWEYCTSDGEPMDERLMNAVFAPGGAGEAPEANFEAEFFASETDEEAMDRIQHTFDMLNEVADACQQGIIRGLVVSGPPGTGKSYGIEEVMTRANMVRTIEGRLPTYEVVKGATSPIGLYKTLYNFRHKGYTVIFDDCDGVLYEDESLNLLKAALDSGSKRRLCWRKESRVLEVEDIPDAFDFEGSVIFLTNVDFARTKASKLKMHLDAIQSRCHYMDLEINTTRDQVLRIKQVVRDGMLNSYEFKGDETEDIVEYIVDNQDYLRELSLRMVKKIADMVKMKPNGWEQIVESTCFTREARFKRMRDIAKSREAIVD